MKNYLYEAGIALAGKHSVRTTHRNYIEFFEHVNPVPSWERIQAKIAELEAAEPIRLLRIERDRLLQQTDWMANSDVVMTDAWKTYRQALRDITQTYTSLDDVIWPEKPE
jgi:hypothetical protein